MPDAVIEPRFRILGCRVVQRAQDGNSAHGLVAIVDIRVPPFVLFGARLYRRRDRAMTLSAPEVDRADGHSSGIRIEDPELKADMCTAACNVAKLLGANTDPVAPPATAFAELAGALKDRSTSDGEA